MEEMHFTSNRFRFYQTVFAETFTHEETAELIVPDAQPDILRFLETEACVMMRGKEADQGQVRVTGVADVTVTYLPDGGGGVRRLTASVPFSAAADGEAIVQECLISARVGVSSADARMLNPRKILLHLTFTAEVVCCIAREQALPNAAEDAESAAAELLPGVQTARVLTEMSEKTFLISDDVTAAGLKLPGAELMRQRVTLTGGTPSAVGSRVVVRGEAAVELLYRPENGGLESVSFAIPYSQMVEFDAPCEDSVFDVCVMLTGAYVTPDADEPGKFAVELHAVAQCAKYTPAEFPYLADAYSTKYDLALTRESCALRSLESCEVISAVARGTVPAGTPAGTVLSVSVRTGAAAVGAGGELSAPLEVTVLYETEDGRLLSAGQRLTASASFASDADSAYRAAALWNGESHTSFTAEGVDVRVPVDFVLRRFREQELTALSGAAYDPEKPADLSGAPSLVLRRFESGGSAWAEAKRYRSTVSLILQANGAAEESELRAGEMLLIPRRR